MLFNLRIYSLLDNLIARSEQTNLLFETLPPLYMTFKMNQFLRICSILRFHNRCLTTQTAKTTGTSLRANIAKNIAKNFNNLPLVQFPLMKPNSLSDHSAIERAHSNCQREHLDDNPNYYPSISTILNQTMSTESMKALKRWEAEKIKYGLAI